MGTIIAPANRHDSPLLAETLDAAAETLGGLPKQAKVHLDRGYDSLVTRERLEDRRLIGEISQKGKPASLGATKRWVVERNNSWHNAHKKLLWCTERKGRVIDFWVAFSEVVIIVRRLTREGWTRYLVGKADLLADHDLLAEALSHGAHFDESPTILWAIVIKARKARFTDSESGKASATSGERTTTLLSAA